MDRSGDSEKVVHPKHYNSHPSGIEAWDVCERFGLNIGCALKYLFRAGLKGGEPKDLDMEKARAYLAREAGRSLPFHTRVNNDLISLLEKVEKADNHGPLGFVLAAWLDAPPKEDRSAKECLHAFDLVTNRKYVP